MASKSSLNSKFLQIMLSIFWGINLPFAFIWEIIENIILKSNKKDKDQYITSKEHEAYDSLFFITIFIPLFITIMLIIFNEYLWFILIIILFILEFLSISFLSFRSNNVFNLSANPEKNLDELNQVLTYLIFDSIIYGLYIILSLNIFVFPNNTFKNASIIIGIISFVFTLLFWVRFYSIKKKNIDKLKKLSNFSKIIRKKTEDINEIKQYIKKIEDITLLASQINLPDIMELGKTTLKKEYKKLLKIHSKYKDKSDFNEVKSDYKNFIRKLKKDY